MKSTVKNISKTRAVVTVSLEASELEAAEQVALKKLSKTIKVDGFRKGRVPLNVVAKHVAADVLAEEVLENALSKGVADAFLSNGLQALERPEVEVKKFVPGSELEFTAEADVLPPVELGDYKKLKATKTKVVVEKKDIDDVIERIRKGYATKEETDAAAEMGDETVIDFIGKRDGTPFDGGTGGDYPLTLGSGSFIPGFEEAIVGHKAGETFDVPLKFPKEYHAKDLAGKDVVFEATIKKVNKVVLPELNDELAAKAGPYTEMKQLEDDIKAEITAQKEREATDALKDELVKQLIEKSEVIAPKVLVDDQVRSIEQDMMQNLMYQGMTLDQYFESKGFKDRDEWVAKEANEAAELRVKAGLVLAELSKAEKIEASADELAEKINAFKTQYANSPDTVKRFDEPEIQHEIANRLLTEKTVDRLVEINVK